ncbi:MAG: transcription antitermination factor NusB [Opitutales bacterium]
MSENKEKKTDIQNSKSGMGRHLNRSVAMQYIYMRDMNPEGSFENTLNEFILKNEEELGLKSGYFSFARELVVGAFTNAESVDNTIEENAKNWSIDRIAKVELAILRLAVFELLYRDDIPPVVTINEAINLTKEFSSEESKRFINGLLDNLSLKLNRPLRSVNKKDI